MNKSQKKIKRIVVKVGSALLSCKVEGEGKGSCLDMKMFETMARQVDYMMSKGVQTAIVSSGAVASGAMRMGQSKLPDRILEKQAWAALGQPHLMHHYEMAFNSYDRPVAQILLTHDDLGDRKRYLNARHTLGLLMEIGAVPIVNENDTIAVEEIKVGDNDTLSAQIATLIDADLLVILTSVEGLLDENGKVIPRVEKIDKKIMSLAGGVGGGFGVGGMVTKLKAAQKAGMMGIPTVIALGRRPDVLKSIVDGEKIGTYFVPAEEKLSKRKHWIMSGQKSKGAIVVDEGAKKAIVDKGKSLLPSGIKEVKGEFQRGEAIAIQDESGIEFAKGLTGYSSEELLKIKGIKSKDIQSVLGYKVDDEAIHRDDMAIL